MAHKHSVNYHPSSSGLMTRMHPLVFLYTASELSLSKNFTRFIIETVYHG